MQSLTDPERGRADAPGVETRVRIEQIGHVHNQGVAGALAMLIIAVLYAGVLWPVTDHLQLAFWFAAMVVVCAARLGCALLWRRSASALATGFWSCAGVIINALAGAAWGYAAVALFPLSHPDRYIVAAFVLVGMPAAALASLGAWAPAYAAYALAAIAPFAVWMFALGQQQFVIVGLASVTFCAYLLRQAQQTAAMFHHNIAQRIALEVLTASLRQARDAAEAASRAKSIFLARMSHELRTPLNAVVGLSDLLVEQPAGSRSAEFAATVRQSALSLLGVIDHVLDLDRIESGKIDVRPRSFDVRALLRAVQAMFNPEAERRRLALRIDIDGAVPPRVTCDPDRVRQVLVNLVDNALKFTAAGAVTVGVTAAARGDGRYQLRFEVADTGIGVDDPDRARVAAALAHGGKAPPGSAEIGLSICAALVKLMDGEIGYRSEPGRGTTFWFTCAIGIAPPSMAREITLDGPVTQSRAVAPRVLIVEDNSVNLLLTKKMLEAFGCAVQSATHGAEGLKRMQAESFDLVFMDISMPGMDGIETTRVWRAHEQSGENRLPIVALTANAMAGDRQACLAAGMDDYLAKPVTLDALRRMVARHVPGVSA